MIALYENPPPQERMLARQHVYESRLRLVVGCAIALRMETTSSPEQEAAARKHLRDTAWEIFMADGTRTAAWAFKRALDWNDACAQYIGDVIEGAE